MIAISGSQYGSGRVEKGMLTDSVKILLIVLHRLLGILASNVPALEDPYSDHEPTSDLLWSVDVRKVDLTDVTGIFQYNQGSSCYRGYLAEYPDSPVYKQLFNSDEDSEAFNFTEVSFTARKRRNTTTHIPCPSADNLIAPCRELFKTRTFMGLSKRLGWSFWQTYRLPSKGVKQRGLFIHRSALNAYLSITGEELIHRRFANRGIFWFSWS